MKHLSHLTWNYLWKAQGIRIFFVIFRTVLVVGFDERCLCGGGVPYSIRDLPQVLVLSYKYIIIVDIVSPKKGYKSEKKQYIACISLHGTQFVRYRRFVPTRRINCIYVELRFTYVNIFVVQDIFLKYMHFNINVTHTYINGYIYV